MVEVDEGLPEFLTSDEPIELDLDIFEDEGTGRFVSQGFLTSLHLCKYGLSNGCRYLYLAAKDNVTKDDRCTTTLIGRLTLNGVEFNDGFTRCATNCAKHQLTTEEKAAIAQALGTAVL